MTVQGDPIGEYVEAVRAQLRAPRLRRRRIASELRAHLIDSAAELSAGTADAARIAVERCGDAGATAAAFNSLPRRRHGLARRWTAASAAWVLAIAMGSATVWAANQPQGSAAGAHAAARSAPLRTGETRHRLRAPRPTDRP